MNIPPEVSDRILERFRSELGDVPVGHAVSDSRDGQCDIRYTPEAAAIVMDEVERSGIYQTPWMPLPPSLYRSPENP